MPTYSDYGIVLSSKDLADTDKILSIYTKENGLVRAIAKGIKKPRSTFSGKVDQLSCCYFQFAKGRNLDIICDCRQINGFPLLRSSLINLTYGILFVEIVSSFAHEMESNSVSIYELLYSSLDLLQSIDRPDLFSVKFVVDFLLLHGVNPQLETCVSCSTNVGKKVADLACYSSILGGLLCNKCSEFIDHKIVNPDILKILEGGTDTPAHNVTLALNLLKEHINVRAKKEIKTFDLVFSL